MLWLKGWLETRFRALAATGLCLFMVFPNRHLPASTPLAPLIAVSTFFWAIIPSALGLAGAGVRTQPAFQAIKGLHGSMHFTLSLPVSRLHLLAVRAALGFLETSAVIATVCISVWATVPALRMHITIATAVAYFLTVTFCVSGPYFLSVFFATFIDEGPWLPLAGLVSITMLELAALKLPPRLAFLNVFRAMGASSPLFTHAMPWASMAVSVGAGMVLLFAAARVIQLREY